MTKTGNDKLMITLKNLVPLAILAAGILVTWTRSDSKIDQLKTDYDKMYAAEAVRDAAEAVQNENIDENEDAIIGIKKDLTFILDRQDVMRSEQKETAAQQQKTAKEILDKLDDLRTP